VEKEINILGDEKINLRHSNLKQETKQEDE
jgi:hypothetical protein